MGLLPGAPYTLAVDDPLTTVGQEAPILRRSPAQVATGPDSALLHDVERVHSNAQVGDRPFVTLAYAQSVDGSIARRRGEPFPLSGPESLRLTHAMRGRHDAILVGVGTILADDPELTVRLADGKDPQPIIVDSRLRTPPLAKLLARSRNRPWIGTTRVTDPGAQRAHPVAGDGVAETDPGNKAIRAALLERRGARLLPCAPLANGWVDLASLLRTLKAEGVTTLMVEGGAEIITSFLEARLVDYAIVTIAPLFLGGLPALGPGGRAVSVAVADANANANAESRRLRSPAAVPRLKTWVSHRLGDDLVLTGEVRWPDP